MPNDPLALSILTIGAPFEADYDAVHAAVVATERGRWFLSEYANRNRNADTGLVIAAIARIEAAVRGDPVPHDLAAATQDLTAIAGAIERIRAAIAAVGMPALDVAGAAERIQDISFGLRERSVDAALCDALDAAARDISEADAKRAAHEDHDQRVAEMLRDLAGRIDALITLSPADQISNEVSGEVPSQDIGRTPTATASLVAERAPLLNLQNEFADAVTLPRDHLDAADASIKTEVVDGPGWYIEVPDFVFQPEGRETENVPAESAGESGESEGLLPGARFQPGPQDDPAGLFETSLIAVAIAPVASPPTPVAPLPAVPAAPVQIASPAEAPAPQPRLASGPAVRLVAHPPPADPLAAMRDLSEDEVVALFG